jgi:hypothetical protein
MSNVCNNKVTTSLICAVSGEGAWTRSNDGDGQHKACLRPRRSHEPRQSSPRKLLLLVQHDEALLLHQLSILQPHNLLAHRSNEINVK